MNIQTINSTNLEEKCKVIRELPLYYDINVSNETLFIRDVDNRTFSNFEITDSETGMTIVVNLPNSTSAPIASDGKLYRVIDNKVTSVSLYGDKDEFTVTAQKRSSIRLCSVVGDLVMLSYDNDEGEVFEIYKNGELRKNFNHLPDSNTYALFSMNSKHYLFIWGRRTISYAKLGGGTTKLDNTLVVDDVELKFKSFFVEGNLFLLYSDDKDKNLICKVQKKIIFE